MSILITLLTFCQDRHNISLEDKVSLTRIQYFTGVLTVVKTATFILRLGPPNGQKDKQSESDRECG